MNLNLNFIFFLNSCLLGVGLAMDAFSVSLANGLNEPKMKTKKMCAIASSFAFFQALMPMIGWICVHTILHYFKIFEKFIPWIALVLLSYIGGKMLIEGIKNKANEDDPNIQTCSLGFIALMIQSIATSIDALSVGFTIADYNLFMALACSIIIAIITFIISVFGLIIGKKVGTKFSTVANFLGGIVLILIGIEIFVTGIF